MRNILLLLTILCCFTSCNNDNMLKGNYNDKKLKQKAFRFAENYTMGQLKGVKKSVDKELGCLTCLLVC
jgi:hypothetical protein